MEGAGEVGGVALVTPEANIGDVCGWLIPARNGLSSHVGAYLEMVEAREVLGLRDWWSEPATKVDRELLCERLDRTDNIDP